MAYRKTSAGAVVRVSDGLLIPADPDNRDWQAYQAWLAEDEKNVPAEADPPSPAALPAISDRQFAQALADLGVISRGEALAFVKRGEVPAPLQAAIDGIADDAERFAADMQASGATTFERAHPSTLALAHALGWSDAQMDDLWYRAAGL